MMLVFGRPRRQLRIFSRDHLRPVGLDDPTRAPGEIARVLRAATDYSLPVYIELPRDMSRGRRSAAAAGFVTLVHDHRDFGSSGSSIRHWIGPYPGG